MSKKRLLIDVDVETHKIYKKLVQNIPITETESYTVKTHTEMLIEQFVKKNNVQLEMFAPVKKN